MKKKITKTKYIEGNTWYYLAEADEIDDEEELPPLSAFERNALLQSINVIKSDIADELLRQAR